MSRARGPRLSISALMALVLIAAFDLGLGKKLFELAAVYPAQCEMLLVGALPMGNILAIGLAALLASRRRGGARRSALIGFEAFGLAAWLADLVGSLRISDAAFLSMTDRMARLSGWPPGPPLLGLGALVFVPPQVAFATLGWLLGRRRGARQAGRASRLATTGQTSSTTPARTA